MSWEAGQTVIWHSWHGGLGIKKIDAVTKAGKAKINNCLYSERGHCIPYDMMGDWIESADEEKIEQVRKEIFIKNTIWKMSKVKWADVITDYETAVKYRNLVGDILK